MSSETCAQWRKSSRSPDWDDCVEMAPLADSIGVRDSKDRGGPVLRFRRAELASLIDCVKAGDLDL